MEEIASYIDWLKERSMLAQAELLSARDSHARYSGGGEQWQRPYAATQPESAAARASVWFTAYPSAIVTPAGQSVLQALADPDLWVTFHDIGISAMHTGPLKRAGGIRGRAYTPTIDGHFDRISMELDPQFGSDAQYKAVVAAAAAHGVTVIGDIVPLHSGKGADWRLAERAVGDYPGLYHMVAIDEADWALLPDVAEGRDSVNLKPEVVDQLAAKEYIIGRLPRVIFYEPGVKESNWSATAPVVGVDGVTRRWVYLHYFKEGQPVFNWLDQTFAAQRLIAGDVLHSLKILGEGMLRLDANGFLGIEKSADGTVISEGHPLAVISNQLIAGLIRKVGGFSFQELNLTLEDMAAMGAGGADLSYDFVTRPAYHHALVTGNASFLRLMLSLMHEYGIRPNTLIHALQNHDELTLELVHFWTRHAETPFELDDETFTGRAIRERVRHEMFSRCMGSNAPYNLQSTTNGIACTTLSLITATLSITDITNLTAAQREQIKRLHLLLVIYNAFQPGVFALSGWDLVGALPLPPEQVQHLMGDGDTRWINRGSYDLLGKGGGADLPSAPSLYGPLPEQLQDPDSFASQLKRLLRLRERYRIYEATQVAVLGKGSLLVMVHVLPDGRYQITAINFGAEPVEQTVLLPEAVSGRVVDVLSAETVTTLTNTTRLPIRLDSYTALIAIIGKSDW